MRTSSTSRPSSAIETSGPPVPPRGRTPGRRLRSLLDHRACRRLRVLESGGCLLLSVDLPGRARAAFSTRVGGVSPPPFASLDLSTKTGDDPELVAANRARLLDAVGRPGRFVSPKQVHGTRVVGAAEYLAECREDGPRGADGLVLQADLDARLVPLLHFADCLPVLLVGEVDMAVVHAGWRGLLDGVIQQAARSMTGPPAVAVLGPSIGPCCYEVGDDVRELFGRRYGDAAAPPHRLDLWAAAEQALAEVGVTAGQVTNPRLCTHCYPEFFYSHRRDGAATGRQGALAWYAQGEAV